MDWHLKLRRQYSEFFLQVCSTHAVSSKESVNNSLGVKYKSSLGVLLRGIWVSMV